MGALVGRDARPRRTGHAIGIGHGAAVTWIVNYWVRVLGRERAYAGLGTRNSAGKR
jgi:hypothetical protein